MTVSPMKVPAVTWCQEDALLRLRKGSGGQFQHVR